MLVRGICSTTCLFPLNAADVSHGEVVVVEDEVVKVNGLAICFLSFLQVDLYSFFLFLNTLTSPSIIIDFLGLGKLPKVSENNIQDFFMVFTV